MSIKGRMAIGLLIAVIFVLALCSLMFISGLREKEPERAKLVDTSEVFNKKSIWAFLDIMEV